MNATRTLLNRLSTMALELGLTKTDLYGISDTTKLQTWGFKYLGYSRSAAIMAIMIERTINTVSAINSTIEGLELMRIFLKHQGLVGEAVMVYIRYVVIFDDGTHGEFLKLADEPSPATVAGIEIAAIPTLDQVVTHIYSELSAKRWTNQCMTSLLSVYSEYCCNISAFNPYSVLGVVNNAHDMTYMLKLAVITAATACNKMISDRPLHTRYMNFIDTLVKYGWLVDHIDTEFLGICIRHNTTNSAPPLDWIIYPADIEHAKKHDIS